MEQTIKIINIFNADLYTRSKATEIANHIQQDADTVNMDFNGIAFMSRSFADELCNVMEKFPQKKFVFIHRNDVVETMMTKVAEGRGRERARGGTPPQMLEFNTMESLEKFLITL